MRQTDRPWVLHRLKVKLKLSLYRPGQAQRVTGVWDSQDFYTQSAHEVGSVVSPTHQPALPSRR